jgi:hypothetical protein
VGPLERRHRRSESIHHQCKEILMATPLTEIREHPPSTYKTSTVGPLGGARASDLRVPTINAKKRQWWALWEVPELEIRERPPST